MKRPSSKAFTDQQLFDWKKAGLNSFEEEQVAKVHGPRMSREELRRYIQDPIRWFTPPCRAVAALFVRVQELEAALRRELARTGGGNPFAAEEPFREFPKLKAFYAAPAAISLDGAIELQSELVTFMEELIARRETMRKLRSR